MATASTLPTDQLREMISAALASGVSKSEIHSMVATTTPPAPTNGHSSDKVRKDDQGLPIYAELPSGMIDLPAAAKKHGGTVGQYRNWISRGRLQPRGRLRAPVRGGGHLVVSEEDLLAYKSVAASRKGRPRKSEQP